MDSRTASDGLSVCDLIAQASLFDRQHPAASRRDLTVEFRVIMS